jgi:hypothetical protein
MVEEIMKHQVFGKQCIRDLHAAKSLLAVVSGSLWAYHKTASWTNSFFVRRTRRA